MESDLIKELAAVTKQNAEQLAVVTNVLKALQQNAIQKTAGTVHDALRMHGQGGIFSTPGLDRDVLTASVRPYGLHAYLPEIPSNDLYPYFATITGGTAPEWLPAFDQVRRCPHGLPEGLQPHRPVWYETIRYQYH